MIKSKGPILWEELSWKDVELLTKKTKIAILPVASTEQHGPHLPLSVDSLEGYEIAKRISEKLRIPVLPPIVYGCSESHGNFPGTLSVRPDTLIHLLEDICSWTYKSGIRKIILLNSHAWNIGPLLSVREDLRSDYPDMQVRVLNVLDVVKRAAAEYSADVINPDHSHGNKAETAEVLAIRPDLVDMDSAVDEDARDYFFEYRMDQISKTGSLGKPTQATKEFGEHLLQMMAGEVIPIIEKAMQEAPPIQTEKSA